MTNEPNEPTEPEQPFTETEWEALNMDEQFMYGHRNPHHPHWLAQRAAGDNIVPLSAYEDEGLDDAHDAKMARWDSQVFDGAEFLWRERVNAKPVWGDPAGGEILWAGGEALILAGGIGAGKTTILLQLLRCRIGLDTEVLGYPVPAGARNTLYFASDRPNQIAKAMRRNTTRTENLDRLKVVEGSPPFNIVEEPWALRDMATRYHADTVGLDSIKDLVGELSSETVGFAINKAFGLCVEAGIEVVGNHHARKASGENTKPNKLADIYGSTWITAGAGSVVFLFGDSGKDEVELLHLKTPEETVGPLTVIHDFKAGRSTVKEHWDPLGWLRGKHDGNTTAQDAALAMTGSMAPTRSEREKARRKLEKLVTKGLATKTEGTTGGEGGTTPTTYQVIEDVL